jgi:hypothetical protein
MKYLLLFTLTLLLKLSFAQTDSIIKQFDYRKNTINHNGMIVLTSWASVNIIGSGAAYSLTKSNEEKEFHLMNASWEL